MGKLRLLVTKTRARGRVVVDASLTRYGRRLYKYTYRERVCVRVWLRVRERVRACGNCDATTYVPHTGSAIVPFDQAFVVHCRP